MNKYEARQTLEMMRSDLLRIQNRILETRHQLKGRTPTSLLLDEAQGLARELASILFHATVSTMTGPEDI